jgi:hypothetical protein
LNTAAATGSSSVARGEASSSTNWGVNNHQGLGSLPPHQQYAAAAGLWGPSQSSSSREAAAAAAAGAVGLSGGSHGSSSRAARRQQQQQERQERQEQRHRGRSGGRR